ncbi:4035_t:CDS:2 [Cetraspora pellucida]|uniref:4035_t:CDS:1 n=1 Tax=Cetraspora pellucida TaxID=1433469 RepID=A0A9N9GZP6_9GLOM|nr:4035_t:CDS:2 [Cetraspora pellucida]
MIIEKFQKYRKTEPTSLFVLKSFVLILLLILLFGYTWLIIWDIYNDNPVVQNSLEEANYIPVPDILSHTNQTTNITCHFVNASGIHDCNQYITYYTGIINGMHTGYFSTNGLMFSTIPNNGISSLELKIYLNDASFNLSDSTLVPDILFSMDDADFDKNYNNGLFVSDQFQLSLYSKFPNTIFQLNQYSLAAFSSYTLKIKRKRKELMLPSWKNYIGFSSNLESIPYITSTLETFPLTKETGPLILLTKITIEPQIFIVQVETDKRFILSVINSLGLIGGACGFVVAIYTTLFGNIAIKPWGLIQKYGFKINKSVQTKLHNTLEFIPFVNHPKTTNNLSNYELKRRLDSLQLFITEYVADVQYLEEIYKVNINKEGNCT